MANWAMSEETLEENVFSIEDRTMFLDSIAEFDDQHLDGWCHLCVYEDSFLRDHILSGAVSEHDAELVGLSCVPLMVSLEIMAEACAFIAGTTAVKTIENVKALDWIALDEGELNLNVHAELINPETKTYRAYILSEDVIAVTADYSFEADWRASAVAGLTEKRKYRWEDHELYTTGMFHGPTFQSI